MNFQDNRISSKDIIRIRTHKLGSQAGKLIVQKPIWSIKWESAIASSIRRYSIFPHLCLIPKIGIACFYKSYLRPSVVGLVFLLAAIVSHANTTEPLTLQQALQYTADRNPVLEAIRYKEKAAEGLVEQAGYRPNPLLSAQFEDFGGTGQNRRGVDSLETTIQASLRLERGGKRQRRVALAKREQEITAFEFMVHRNEALVATAMVYINTLENQERTDLASEQLILAEATIKAVDDRLKAGASSHAEAARARIALANAQIEYHKAQAAFAAARSRLAANWGGLSSEVSFLSGNLRAPTEMPLEIEYRKKLGNHPLFILQESIIESRRAKLELETVKPDEVLKVIVYATSNNLAQLFNCLTPHRRAILFDKMPPDMAKNILTIMDPTRAAISLAQMAPKAAERLMSAVHLPLANELKELMAYPLDSAGFLMDSKVFSVRKDTDVESTLLGLRVAKMTVLSQIYVIDEKGLLIGSVSLRELAIAPLETPIGELAKERNSVKAVEPREEVLRVFEESKLSSIPVVDYEGKLLGVIRYDAIISAAQENALEGLQSMVGASPEERALSPVWFSVRKRLPWLQINLLTAFLAASVVGIFENTIAQFTALAVLLPVVAGQSGNTGAQALAVTIRGLTVREVRISQWFRLVKKETLTGLFNGVAVAIVTGIGVYIWSHSLGLVLVISVSMVVSMMIAGLSGAAIPILLKLMKQDPAQSSSIVLTTVTDVFGFFAFLGLATILSDLLVSS